MPTPRKTAPKWRPQVGQTVQVWSIALTPFQQAAKVLAVGQPRTRCIARYPYVQHFKNGVRVQLVNGKTLLLAPNQCSPLPTPCPPSHYFPPCTRKP